MLISLSLLIPAVLGGTIALSGLISPTRQQDIRRIVAVIAPVAVLPGIGVSLVDVDHEVDLPWMLFGISLSVDAIARALLVIGAILYGTALVWISWAQRSNTEKSSGALAGFLLACYTGNIGVYLAADAVSFYLFFAIMSFSAVGLVVHYRTARSYRATRIYLTMTVASETALLAGLFFTVQAGGSMLTDAPSAILESPRTGLILALLLTGFGIKAGLAPLHIWLPLAYSASPPAAAAVLSGAMSKAGLVGMLRFFPLDGAEPAGQTAVVVESFAWVAMALAMLGTFGAVLVGALQHNARTVLAYSSISQMGFMVTVVVAGLLDTEIAQDASDATVLYAVHHGLTKGALFVGVAVLQRYGDGLGRLLAWLGMASAGLALVGAPLTSGGIAKYVSKEAVGMLTVAGIDLEYVLPLVATGSAVLLLRILWIVGHEQRQRSRPVEARLYAWLGLCLAGIVLPWFIGAQWSPLKLPEWSDPITLWDAIWPVALGLLIAAAVWWMGKRWWLSVKQPESTLIPAGDLVMVAERVTVKAQTDGAARLKKVHQATATARIGLSTGILNVTQQFQTTLSELEDRLGQWPRFGTVVIVLLTLIVVVSLIFARGT